MKKKPLPYFYTKNDFSNIGDFSVSQNKIQNRYAIHQHDFYEMEIITDGRATHLINGTEHQIEKNDLILITPNDFHGFEHLDMTTITVHFNHHDLSADIARILTHTEACVIKNVNEETLRDFEDMLQIFKTKSEWAPLFIRNRIEKIIIKMFADGNISVDRTIKTADRISEAIGYINMNYRNELSLKKISAIFGISPSYMSRMFKERIGKGVVEYITEKRLEYAKKLLLNGESVTDTCYECGFLSERNFSRQFRRAFDMSPKEYVKRKNMS